MVDRDYANFTYPIFTSGQTLKSKNLNDLVSYLETHDRVTRAWLIGSGIFYGLEWSYEPDGQGFKLCIEKGAGVSSAGHLFVIEQVTNEKAAGNFKQERLCLNAWAKVKMEYDDFNPAVQVNQSFEPMEFLLIPDGSPIPEGFKKEQPPVDKFPETHVLVLYWEAQEKELKTCINSCDSNGKDRELNLRIFAMSEQDLAAIWHNKPQSSSGGGSSSSDVLPYLGRLHKTNPLTQMKTPDDLYAAWAKTIGDAIPASGSLPEPLADATGMSAGDISQTLKTLLTPIQYSAGAPPKPETPNLQYLYDYLCDLVAAYNEWAAIRPRSVLTLCPDETLFPNFIALGSQMKDPNTKKPVCRMPFYRLPIEGVSEGEQAKVSFLAERLKWLLDHARPFNSLPDEIRITGSDFKSRPLSAQAIPFYFNNLHDARDIWNYELDQAGRNRFIQAYENPDEIDYPRNILCYDLKGSEFFRIEGHIWKELSEGFTQIDNLRRDHKGLNLPFEITCVRLGGKYKVKTPPPGVSPQDPELEEILEQLVFDTFAKTHPGMEHMAGVPKGGTFILVYTEVVDSKIELEIQKAIEHGNEELKKYLVDNFVELRIIGDFCLPYSCFKAPKVEYKFVHASKNVPPVADFDEISRVYFRDAKGKLICKIIFKNNSQFEDSLQWSVSRNNGGSWDAALIEPEPSGQKEDYAGEFVMDEKNAKNNHALVLLKAVNTFGEHDYVKGVELCPPELTLCFVNDEGEVLGTELTLPLPSDGSQVQVLLKSAPTSGKFVAPDGLKVVENADKTTATLEKIPDITTTYTIQYLFACDMKRDLRLTIVVPEERPADPRAERFAANLDDLTASNATLASNEFFVETQGFIRSEGKNAVIAAGEFDKLGKKLFSTKRPATATAEEYTAMYRNAAFRLLDQIVKAKTNPKEMPDVIEKSLTNIANVLKTTKTDPKTFLEEWSGADLKTKSNTPLLEAIEKRLTE